MQPTHCYLLLHSRIGVLGFGQDALTSALPVLVGRLRKDRGQPLDSGTGVCVRARVCVRPSVTLTTAIIIHSDCWG